jgi:hypothetical protein
MRRNPLWATELRLVEDKQETVDKPVRVYWSEKDGLWETLKGDLEITQTGVEILPNKCFFASESEAAVKGFIAGASQMRRMYREALFGRDK